MAIMAKRWKSVRDLDERIVILANNARGPQGWLQASEAARELGILLRTDPMTALVAVARHEKILNMDVDIKDDSDPYAGVVELTVPIALLAAEHEYPALMLLWYHPQTYHLRRRTVLESGYLSEGATLIELVATTHRAPALAIINERPDMLNMILDGRRLGKAMVDAYTTNPSKIREGEDVLRALAARNPRLFAGIFERFENSRKDMRGTETMWPFVELTYESELLLSIILAGEELPK